jgi:hypothetical protein
MTPYEALLTVQRLTDEICVSEAQDAELNEAWVVIEQLVLTTR